MHGTGELATWVFKGKGPFKNLGDTLPIGQQKDTHSCGICVMNAMEHVVFGAPLFTARTRESLRIRYFSELVTYLTTNVGSSSCGLL